MLLYPNQKIKWQHPLAKAGNSNSSTADGNDSLNVADSLVKRLQVTDYGIIKEVAWKENKLEFDADMLGDIAIQLERWYGAKIEFEDDSLRYYRFTSTIEKEDITTVLDLLKESKKFNYKIEYGETLKVNLSK